VTTRSKEAIGEPMKLQNFSRLSVIACYNDSRCRKRCGYLIIFLRQPKNCPWRSSSKGERTEFV